VKEFVVYTVLRILLLVASFGVVFGIWALVADSVPLLWVVVIAFVLSGLASYFLLNGPRTAFAARVEERAARASAAFEDRRAREDVD
jgi:protein-S-isoprenylcysteine O-methyltransferase Ste14